MRRIAWALAFVVAVIGQGCSTVNRFSLPPSETIPTSAGNTTYSMGKATQIFDKDLRKVRTATLAAMKDLKVQTHTIRETLEDGAQGIEGKTADGKSVKVVIEPLNTQSRVTAHVGLIGDKRYELALIDGIAEHLELKPSGAGAADDSGLDATSATKSDDDVKPASNDASAGAEAKPSLFGAWRRRFSKSGVPDEVMLHDVAIQSNYRDTPGGF